jgi:hypothetical protein
VVELIVRFVVGGIVVSLFALLGDALKPKSFAGLTGAAPSVALATISLTILKKGASFAATEAQFMVLGAVSFLLYACLVSRVLMRGRSSVLATTALSLLVWLVFGLGLWYLLRGWETC